MINSVLALTVPFIFVIIIVWMEHKEKSKRNQLQADLYLKALEKGQTVPPDLFADPKKQHNPLNNGIICIAVGIGLSLFFIALSAFIFQMDGNASSVFLAMSSVGIIPFLIGVAFLIIYYIEKKNSTTENAK